MQLLFTNQDGPKNLVEFQQIHHSRLDHDCSQNVISYIFNDVFLSAVAAAASFESFFVLRRTPRTDIT